MARIRAAKQAAQAAGAPLFVLDGAVIVPRRVVLLAGRNKIVDTQADAERRVQQIAGPKNVARHTGFRTPCAVTGLCADCNSPQRICNSRVWLERCYPAGRILVLLIDEEAGL